MTLISQKTHQLTMLMSFFLFNSQYSINIIIMNYEL